MATSSPSLSSTTSSALSTVAPSSNLLFKILPSTTPFTLAPTLVSNSSIDSSLSDVSQHPLNASLIVLLTVLFLIFLLAVGLFFFGRWDALDRKILMYVPAKGGESHRGARSLAELAASRRAIDDAFIAGSLPSGVLDEPDDIEFDQRNRRIRSMHQLLRCCVPRSEELSIFMAGNLLPRFLHALRRYHPWVWFFSEGSRKSTRVMRFVMTFKFLLTSLFVTTVLYDINYPSAEVCTNLNHQQSACLATPPNIITKASTCMYVASSNLCMLRPPPGNPSFLILVAFLTVAVMVPFNVIFTLVLTLICSKRPRVEALGLDALEWLGSADPAVSKQIINAEEESERVTAVVRSIYGALFHYCERQAEGLCGLEELKSMDFVLLKLGLVIIDKKIELTLYSKLWRSDVNSCIRYHVQRSLKNAREIQRNMEQYSSVLEKESYLIQHFLINRFSFLFRVSLTRYFAHFTRDVPQTIHPVPWILGWLFIIASIISFLAWILWWGNKHSHSATISNWGINFALINFQEVFIFSVARIFFVNVLAIETIRPQLENMHKYLTAMAKESSKRSAARVPREGDPCKPCLFQYLDPLLWAAKLSGAHNFDHVADADLLKLSDGEPVSFDTEDHEEEDAFPSVVRLEPGGECVL